MSTRDDILAAALEVLEDGGIAQFSTRIVCARAKVTAPTLYHHFGSADGLLSAVIALAFQQFLASKRAAVQSSDPQTALREGWDDYVRFAAARPKLYAAMAARLLGGAEIEAAAQGNAALRAMVEALDKRLALPVESGAQLVWASANAAAQLYTDAYAKNGLEPEPAVIEGMREAMLRVLLTR
ncbi:MAG: helix-turn-helix domain-containing protein [Devosia sp.]